MRKISCIKRKCLQPYLCNILIYKLRLVFWYPHLSQDILVIPNAPINILEIDLEGLHWYPSEVYLILIFPNSKIEESFISAWVIHLSSRDIRNSKQLMLHSYKGFVKFQLVHKQWKWKILSTLWLGIHNSLVIFGQHYWKKSQIC